MANQGDVAPPDDLKITREVVSARGIPALVRESLCSAGTIARVAAGAPVMRANLRAIVSAARRLAATPIPIVR